MYKKQIAIIGATLSATAVAFALTTSNLLPTSDGTYIAWTPKSGSTHYTMVDESSCNGITDYVSTGTIGARDSYGVNVSSIPNGATVTDIAVTPCASKSKNSGTAVMDVFYRLDGVNSVDAGAYSLTGTTPVSLAATTFSGLSYSKSPTTTLQIGAKYTSGSTAARLSKIAAVVTYTISLPNTPSNLNATAVSSSTNYATLTWTDNSNNETGFMVEKSTDGISFNLLTYRSANVTNYSDFAVSASTTYYYRVSSYNQAGTSTASGVASVTMP